MASTDVALTDGWRCRSCAHPKLALCECTCCAADEEAEFAEFIEAAAAEVLADADMEAYGDLMRAADWHQVRGILTGAGLEREG